MTNAGKILGLIGTILAVLGILLFIVIFFLGMGLAVSEHHELR